MYDLCSYGSRSKLETKVSVYIVTAESAPYTILCSVALMDNKSTQVDATDENVTKILYM